MTSSRATSTGACGRWRDWRMAGRRSLSWATTSSGTTKSTGDAGARAGQLTGTEFCCWTMPTWSCPACGSSAARSGRWAACRPSCDAGPADRRDDPGGRGQGGTPDHQLGPGGNPSRHPVSDRGCRGRAGSATLCGGDAPCTAPVLSSGCGL